jgi:hypothetical protein
MATQQPKHKGLLLLRSSQAIALPPQQGRQKIVITPSQHQPWVNISNNRSISTHSSSKAKQFRQPALIPKDRVMGGHV